MHSTGRCATSTRKCQ